MTNKEKTLDYLQYMEETGVVALVGSRYFSKCNPVAVPITQATDHDYVVAAEDWNGLYKGLMEVSGEQPWCPDEHGYDFGDQMGTRLMTLFDGQIQVTSRAGISVDNTKAFYSCIDPKYYESYLWKSSRMYEDYPKEYLTKIIKKRWDLLWSVYRKGLTNGEADALVQL